MAPLPENSTARYWVDYRAHGRDHSALFRYNQDVGVSGFPPNDFIVNVVDFFTFLLPVLPTDFAVRGARYSDRGSGITLPGPIPIIGAGTGAIKAGEAPAFITFVGRSPTGRAWRLSLLGVALSPADDAGVWGDYRVQATENATINNAIEHLRDFPALVAIDGGHPLVYAYINAGYNAHWQRKMRG